MRLRIFLLSLFAAILMAMPTQSKADNGAYTYAGGTFSTGTVAGQSIVVQNVPLSSGGIAIAGATMSFSCPIATYGAGTYALNWTCAGGTVTIATPDSSVVFKGTLIAGSMNFSGSGGGRYGHTTYYYSFFGTFSGTVTSGGSTQVANGSISQYVKTSKQIGTGTAAVTAGSLGWNSAYSPLFVGDNANGRIVGADSITGANLASYGTPGSGTGHFTSIAGLAQDATGRIYATDSALSHLVRIDNLTGKNWAQLGGYGTGAHHFSSPQGVAVDATGKIWVADAGNNRIVRFDDMSGTNWTAFGTSGTGANQFNHPSGIAFDALGRIYVADTGNNRLVRMDDLTGTNWIALTEVFSGIYGYPLNMATSVAVNPAGQIFVALGGSYSYLIRVDDMTGANPSLSQWSGGLSSISLDKAGAIYVTGGFSPGLAEVEGPTGVGFFSADLGGTVPRPSVVLAAPSATPTPAAPAFISSGSALPGLTFGSQNIGEPSPPQSAVLTNLGSGALTISSIAPGIDFLEANTCGGALAGGASCVVNVRFNPRLAGQRSENLVVSSNGVHPTIKLKTAGVGTAPTAAVLPAALTFDTQTIATSSAAQTVTLSNNGTGPLTIKSIVAAGDFSQTNNCGTGVLPGNGCTISVVFKPSAAGTRTGSVTISDDLVAKGATQVVALSGTGATGAAAFTLSPESLLFPMQAVGTTSNGQIVTLTNHSGAAAVLGAPTYPAGFKVTTSCGATLANNAACVFHAAFAPTAAGSVSGAVTIPVTGSAALTVGLSGTGAAAAGNAALVPNPAIVDYGQLVVGDNPAMTVTFTNSTGLPVAIQSIHLAGPSDFSITANTCSGIIPGQGSCTVEFTVIPLVADGTETATFTLTEGSGAQTQVTLTAQVFVNGG